MSETVEDFMNEELNGEVIQKRETNGIMIVESSSKKIKIENILENIKYRI